MMLYTVTPGLEALVGEAAEAVPVELWGGVAAGVACFTADGMSGALVARLASSRMKNHQPAPATIARAIASMMTRPTRPPIRNRTRNKNCTSRMSISPVWGGPL